MKFPRKDPVLLAMIAGLAVGVAFAEPASPIAASSGLDAQAVYSAADVGAARRTYRAQCVRFQNADLCECMTSGFAQSLSPDEVRLAAAELPGRFGRTPARSSRWSGETRATMIAHISAAQAEYASACERTY